ncbi:MAG: ATP-dependent 6-phosphofructokinase [Elusimicrobia bacterium]|nr:ATP-dependent 6-phosphofructokinase [Elusimicrobiota bacterium]
MRHSLDKPLLYPQAGTCDGFFSPVVLERRKQEPKGKRSEGRLLKAKKIGILTGGGDCPGLNPAIRACVLMASRLGYDCIGILDGWKGLIENKTMPLSISQVENLISQGGTIVGTSRTNPYKKEGGVPACLENFKKLDLEALVAMGGEDTLGVANKLFKESHLAVIGVPKTMDNDLSATDYTFGFDTSVTIAMQAAQNLKDTGKSHHRIMILEVMGRHAGWVALFTGIASGADYICLPERRVNVAQMTERLQSAHQRKGYALVVASEAIDLPDADAEKAGTKDEFGHIILKERGVAERLSELIENKTNIETRSAVIGHIQRGGPPTLFDRILSTRAGAKAAEMAGEKRYGMMVALRGTDVVPVPLEEATAKLKTVPESWLKLVDILCQC